MLYLLAGDNRLTVAALGGYHETSRADVEGLFGHEALFRSALRGGTPIAIPSPAVDAGTAADF